MLSFLFFCTSSRFSYLCWHNVQPHIFRVGSEKAPSLPFETPAKPLRSPLEAPLRSPLQPFDPSPFSPPPGSPGGSPVPEGWGLEGFAPRGGPKPGKNGGGGQQGGAPKGGGKKFGALFPSPATIFFLSSLAGGPFVEFWWCF